jgi:proteic killer suppression protein
VRIRHIVHKGLRRLYENDDSKGLPADAVDKLRKMLAFLDAIAAEEEVRDVPTNWRLTFEIDGDEIAGVDFEDYH